jgi:hypothetical protein
MKDIGQPLEIAFLGQAELNEDVFGRTSSEGIPTLSEFEQARLVGSDT